MIAPPCASATRTSAPHQRFRLMKTNVDYRNRVAPAGGWTAPAIGLFTSVGSPTTAVVSPIHEMFVFCPCA